MYDHNGLEMEQTYSHTSCPWPAWIRSFQRQVFQAINSTKTNPNINKMSVSKRMSAF